MLWFRYTTSEVVSPLHHLTQSAVRCLDPKRITCNHHQYTNTLHGSTPALQFRATQRARELARSTHPSDRPKPCTVDRVSSLVHRTSTRADARRDRRQTSRSPQLIARRSNTHMGRRVAYRKLPSERSLMLGLPSVECCGWFWGTTIDACTAAHRARVTPQLDSRRMRSCYGQCL